MREKVQEEEPAIVQGGQPDAAMNDSKQGILAHSLEVENIRKPVFAAAFLLVLMAWIFWDFFERQFQNAVQRQADWGHTLVIPFIAGYLIYLNRRKLLEKSFRTTWIGLLPIVVGILWYIACNVGVPALRHHNLMGLGVGVTMTGLTLLFFGWRATILLLFPLTYLFVFGQTISDRFMNIITFRLQDITALGSYFLLDIFLDVDLRGNTLFIFDQGVTKPLNIAEACSGMRMLMAFLALGVFMAYTGMRHLWQRTFFVLMAFPIAIVVNILRVVTLGLLSLLDVEFAAGDFHSFIGLVWLVPAYLLYLGLRQLISRLVIEDEETENSEASSTPSPYTGNLFDRHSRYALLVVAILLVFSSFGFNGIVYYMDVYLKKEPVPLRTELSRIPSRLGFWQADGPDQLLDVAQVESLGTSRYLNRTYVREDGRSGKIMLHIAYYTGMIDPVPHVPDRCFTAGGLSIKKLPVNLPLPIDTTAWREVPEKINASTGQPYRSVESRKTFTGEAIEILMPIGKFRIRTTEFEDITRPSLRIFAGYYFIANGRLTPSPDGVRLLAFDLSDRYAFYCKVQFTMIGGRNLDQEAFVRIVTGFTDELLPELMRCLPDWSEVEAGTAGTEDRVNAG